MSALDNSGSFLARNKTLVSIAATVAGISAVGALYYYSQQGPTPSPEDSTASKKKNKKKKKSKPEDSKDTSAAPASPASSKIYPVGKDGLPDLSEATISNLTADQKSEWALALKEDGNTEYKAKNYKEAVAFYSAALKLKVDPVFYSNRSACYAALDDHENVVKDTTEAIKLKPDYTKCLLRRATSYEILEQYPDAMFDLTALTIYGGFSNKSVEQVLERVLKKHSVRIVEQNIKTRVLDLPSASTTGSFFGAFVTESNPEGISEESTGNDKLLFDAIAKINSNTPEGYEEADKLIAEAVSGYDAEGLKADSDNAAKASIAYEYAATFKFLKNDPLSAAVDIGKAVSLKPRSRTYVIRALINADKSSYEDARNDFASAAKMDSNAGDAYYHLGQLFYLTNELDKAQENFEKAKKANPQNVYAYVQSACITYKNGDIKEAEDKFTEAKLKFPTSPEIPNYYGEVLSDRGDIQAALKQFETAARLQKALPNYSVGALPLVNKASLISRENFNKLDEAEELLVEACKLDPKSELARISLAQLKLQKEQVDEAIVLFEESSNLARTIEEKVQATSFAEATKMQKRIKADPILSEKIAEVMRQSMMAAGVAN
ncbi:hypothetical protein CANTEDRAFT_118183 [Yamadazyma tenuis ATCC 10573]|uniref:TPR-like protein n=1 Tax=Candida tenuis (strain ATCC 10573 / BCRC 21748 / CBS 615 / JCM 9827 / NBRC 10315 / NRRL Y-1498 / VKM Y-70) TaxID=590646 RepID=G3AXR6_CANTC|nr:uncharacterized protein CANTEDRAFT_118183 [Yamadazyma tenuis ATCC 10573]EGV65677.1 hypothetical protein CANTEDRAFT_118183 [Yamadazyma tenuis ATCC 10573]